MSDNLISAIALLSPIVFILTSAVSWLQPGIKPKHVIFLSRASATLSLLIAGICSFYAIKLGLIESAFLGIAGMGLSIRLDSVSLIMLGMISLLSFIIIKFSIRYLDGDPNQGLFMGRLAATIASVQLLVLSGNLGLLFISWVLTSLSLHRLLVFYRDRSGAQIAAKKKFIMARLGDVCVLISIILLYTLFGTGNLEVIFTTLNNTPFTGHAASLEFAALFLALAAILKSAQFPTHGWLIEVMETPTPVSALLHAGILNAGPFLIIRMAYVMDASSIAPMLLLIIGGFTALFASVVYLTQTSIKTAFGYSSVGHMGFSLMVCGLGVYPAAMLHLVAHSFYKAHSFLSSGSVIDVIKASKIISVKKSISLTQIIAGILLALAIFTGFALLWGIDPVKEGSLLIIGGVIILGLSHIFITAISLNWNLKLFMQATLLACGVTVAFFGLETGTHVLMQSNVPDTSTPGLGKILVAGLLLAMFSLTVIAQNSVALLSDKPYYKALAIHIRNGFYANVLFDRLIGSLRINSEGKMTVLKEPVLHKPFPKNGINNRRSL